MKRFVAMAMLLPALAGLPAFPSAAPVAQADPATAAPHYVLHVRLSHTDAPDITQDIQIKDRDSFHIGGTVGEAQWLVAGTSEPVDNGLKVRLAADWHPAKAPGKVALQTVLNLVAGGPAAKSASGTVTKTDAKGNATATSNNIEVSLEKVAA